MVATSMDILDGIREVAYQGAKPRRIIPIDLTRTINPKPIHILDDTQLRGSLVAALSQGATSIGIDVWLKDGFLLVGGSESVLEKDRTFADWYVKPMLNLARFVNNEVVDKSRTKWRGLYYRSPELSVQIVVRLRTEPEATLSALIRELEPLSKENFLSTYDSSIASRPHPAESPFRADAALSRVALSVFTVVVQGRVRHIAERAAIRDYFYAEDMANVAVSSKKLGITINPEVSPVVVGTLESARAAQNRDKADDQTDLIKSILSRAHRKKVKVLFTDVPMWPAYKRDAMWKQLYELHADYIPTADAATAANF